MTLQQMIELIQLNHPKVGSVLVTKLINNAMLRFAKDTYCTGTTKSVVNLSGVVLAGSSGSSPVTLTVSSGTAITLQAYKDSTVDSVTLLPSASILFYSQFFQRDINGALINAVSVTIAQDGTVYFYDTYGNALSEFPSDIKLLEIMYVRAPTALSALSSSSEFKEDYNEAICDWVVGSLYPTRTDMPTIDRLQLEKHYKNRYDIERIKALKYYRQHNSLITVSGVVSTEFSS
jgi:hypothetical protein